MNTENTKYNRLINVLKNYKPVLNDPEILAESVIRQINVKKSEFKFIELIMEFFFGWVYIGWMRRSLVTAAMLLIAFFGYQQIIILQRINELAEQKIQGAIFTKTDFSEETYNRNMIYSITRKKFPDTNITVSEKEIEKMIRSVNKLQLKYGDLFYLIENDPQIKEYVENKMNKSMNKVKN